MASGKQILYKRKAPGQREGNALCLAWVREEEGKGLRGGAGRPSWVLSAVESTLVESGAPVDYC